MYNDELTLKLFKTKQLMKRNFALYEKINLLQILYCTVIS